MVSFNLLYLFLLYDGRFCGHSCFFVFGGLNFDPATAEQITVTVLIFFYHSLLIFYIYILCNVRFFGHSGFVVVFGDLNFDPATAEHSKTGCGLGVKLKLLRHVSLLPTGFSCE